jgi:hypothetical protein
MAALEALTCRAANSRPLTLEEQEGMDDYELHYRCQEGKECGYRAILKGKAYCCVGDDWP